MLLRDGRSVPVDDADLRRPAEAALRALSAAVVLLSLGLVGARLA
jgi:hypothetical protein